MASPDKQEIGPGGIRPSRVLNRENTGYIVWAQQDGVDPTEIVGAANLIPTEQNRMAWGGIQGPPIIKGQMDFPNDQSEQKPPTMDSYTPPSLNKKAGDREPGGGWER